MAGITALGVIMIFAIMNDGWRAVLRAVEKDGWECVWKVTLIGTCGLFALLSVLVTVGGALGRPQTAPPTPRKGGLR